jgi:hypothetical protein
VAAAHSSRVARVFAKGVRNVWVAGGPDFTRTARQVTHHDRNLPFSQAADLVQRLRAQRVPFEQLMLPDEIHGFLRWKDRPGLLGNYRVLRSNAESRREDRSVILRPTVPPNPAR